MTREEAKDYAKTMSFRNAVYNALQGKCIPYRKATLIKLNELLDIIEPRKGKETETWNGIHLQITAPKGTFERIYYDTDSAADNDI